MKPQRPATTTTRRPATAPAPMTEERRKALALPKSPGLDLAIGLAFWGGFAALVLHYLGVIR